jgi:hypothetical protein
MDLPEDRITESDLIEHSCSSSQASHASSYSHSSMPRTCSPTAFLAGPRSRRHERADSAGKDCGEARSSYTRSILTRPEFRSGKDWRHLDIKTDGHGRATGSKQQPKGILRKDPYSSVRQEMMATSDQNTIEFWMNIIVMCFFVGGIYYLFMSPDTLQA